MVVKPYEREGVHELEIVRRFADCGFQIHPEALALLTRCRLKAYGSWHFDLETIAQEVTKSVDASVCVISPVHVSAFIKRNGKQVEEQQPAEAPVILRSYPEQCAVGEHKNFLPHFMDRYERLSAILQKRLKCTQIRFLKSRRESTEDLTLVGMVSAIRKTERGNLLVDLEDPTGNVPVIVSPREELLLDEVIGVTGFLATSGFFIAHKIYYPDLPLPNSALQASLPSTAEQKERNKSIHVVFISDMHVGSTSFLEGAWDRFVEWLKTETADQHIPYLVVAGDVVDGIGVYPGQEEDLMITDIEEQYRVAARYFHQLPSHLHVIISPGNHDAVRGAEPQPPLPEYIRTMFPSTTDFVSSPAYIQLGGRRVLVYHGQSYDDLVNAIPRLTYSKPEDAMVEMLKRRHLAPIYGNSLAITPQDHDYGVIDLVPDIFHCGHTHTVGQFRYRNVLLINSGTWQAQTPYQKKRDITPVPGCATVVDLSSMQVQVRDFVSPAGA
ncbi:MAG: DNA-directed DNA polymerase II small subunit [Methanomicrobia archaeon]|nr:DNA-directed DNA polymerase II small subunit [Methanomicrobia archaeon]